MKSDDFSRIKKMKLNSVSAVLFLLLNVISGFVLPKLIMVFYGSATNGLVNSVNQFLQMFTFLDMGMGVVVVSSLYRPIAQRDDIQRNKIVSSATKFYRNIGIILIVYVCFLILFFPSMIGSTNNRKNIAIMILAISASMFVQYYFGIVDRCVLAAYQKEYICNFVKSALVAVNMIVNVILIISGCTIEMVKVATACIMIINPVGIRIYLNGNYHINRKEKYTKEPIKQKWNGIAQHISYVVCQSTDTVILTLFSTLENVSIYAVYNLVSNGLSSLVSALFSGAKSLMGDLHAQKEEDKLKAFFMFFEWGVHNICILIFASAASLIIDFVYVYTLDISDADYIQPFFGFVFMLSAAAFSLRMPYSMLLQAHGHYQQTQSCYVISALINVGISAMLVRNFGLVGVAFGTLISMLYQMIHLAVYCYKELFHTDLKSFGRLTCIDIISFGLIFLAESRLRVKVTNYAGWGVKAMFCVGIGLVILAIISFVCFPDYIKRFCSRLIKLK